MSNSVDTAHLSETAMANEYYFWLCDLIKINQPNRSYWLLIKTLHEKMFYWTVPNDDNRVFESKKLRECFCEENNYDWFIYNKHHNWCIKDVSILELIIALAHRCENFMIDQNDNMSMCDWFWKLLSNISLDKFTDDTYYYLNGSIEIDKILNKINERTYKKDGREGLFPLKKPKKDQRKVEFWYQMCAYLIENYYIIDQIV